jgi:hypothetical protein
METITIEAEIGEDRQLIYQLPPEIPVGRVRLTIQPIENDTSTDQQPLTRDEVRRRLQAAGKLLQSRVAPEGIERSSQAEDRRLADLFGAGPSVETLLDLDRGPRE